MSSAKHDDAYYRANLTKAIEENAEKEQTLLHDVIACPICKQEHSAVLFTRFQVTSSRFTHWAECYSNGDPYMLDEATGDVIGITEHLDKKED